MIGLAILSYVVATLYLAGAVVSGVNGVVERATVLSAISLVLAAIGDFARIFDVGAIQ